MDPRKIARKDPRGLRLADELQDGDLINFGDVPEDVNELLQMGVAAYYDDRPAADGFFRQALAAAPGVLPVYFCLYKIHTYQGNLDTALAVAEAGLVEAARQANIARDWRDWQPDHIDWTQHGAVRFALYTLKALAFISLRRSDTVQARAMLAQLARLDPRDYAGGSVVASLAARVDA